jgi:tetratricopeptide (TPR) repeat protein
MERARLSFPIRLPTLAFATLVVATIGSLVIASAGPAAAQQSRDTSAPSARDGSTGRQQARPAKPETRPAPETVSSLLDKLAVATDPDEARRIATRIERIWLRSGSDTADLLMTRSVQALVQGDHALSIELLDRVLTLKPDWAEAWNRRATAFFLLGDFERSMADLQQVLRREPRHYAALTGLGVILQTVGDKKRAFQAFRKAAEIHPQQEMVKQALERLTPEVEGRDI